MTTEDYLSIIATVVSIISLIITCINNYSIAKIQAKYSMRENNRLKLIDVNKELKIICSQFDEYLDCFVALPSITDNEQKSTEIFNCMVKALNKSLLLYENNKFLLTRKNRDILDEKKRIAKKISV